MLDCLHTTSNSSKSSQKLLFPIVTTVINKLTHTECNESSIAKENNSQSDAHNGK